MKKINLSAYHPILDIQDHIVFANNGNIVLCYEVENPEVYSLSESDFEDIHGAWFQAFKSLPVATVIHKQDMYQKGHYVADELPNDTFLQKATHDYFKGREFIKHSSYLYFILPYNKALNAAKFTNPFRPVEKGIHQQIDHHVLEFIASVNDAVSFINNSRKVSLRPLEADEIISISDAYFNGFNEGFDTDIQLKKSTIEIGENHFDVLAVNSELCFGDVVQTSKTNDKFTSDDFVFHQGFIDGLGLNLNENHIVNQIIYLDDKHKWRKLLDKKIEELKKSSNFGTQNKVILTKMEEEAWEKVIAVNLSGVFKCTKAVAPHMLKQGTGVILNASSVVGLYGNIGQTNYAATKAGVIGLTKSWSKEFGPKGIRVNAVAPGFIETGMTAAVPNKVLDFMKDKTPLRKLGKPEDIASAYIYLASDEANYVNGAILSVDGGLVV